MPAVRREAPHLAEAAVLIADRWSAGGRLVFVGAGTSGRIAHAEAAELPGTFGLPRERVVALVAGGLGSADDAEDDLDLAAADVAALEPRSVDVVVVVAASGTTPYTLAIARAVRAAGAALIAVTARTPSDLAAVADVAVEIAVGPEVLRGSSRLTAGTAQKIALNAITTAAMSRLGRVHGNLMIDVEPANAKLAGRAAGIVAEIAGCDPDDARDALARCGTSRAAVVHLVTGAEPDEAVRIAASHPRLRDAMQELSGASGAGRRRAGGRAVRELPEADARGTDVRGAAKK